MKTSQKKIARIAGILYLINAITGAIGIIIVPGKLIVTNDIAATAQNIINNEFLFRIGILSSISCQIVFIFLALTLFNLFENVSRNLTRALLSLVIVSVPIAFYLIFSQLEAFELLKNNYMTSIELIQKQELAMSKLQIYQDGVALIGVFWGLWLIPFGQLVYKSGFIPKVFGVFLIVGGSSYLLDVCVFILIPEFHRQTNILVAVISSIAEVSMVVWLLIKGIKLDNETPVLSKTH
jgi:hypothetical protein